MAKVITPEMKKKAWDYGSQSKAHYEVLTSEQKKAFWEHGRDNKLYDPNKLDDYKKNEYSTYVKPIVEKPIVKPVIKKPVTPKLQAISSPNLQAQRTGVNGRPIPMLDQKKLNKASEIAAPFVAGLSNVGGITEALGLNNEFVKENPNKRFTTVNGRGIPVSLKLPDITPYGVGNLASMAVTGNAISKGVSPITKAVGKKLTKNIAKKVVPQAIDTVAQAAGFTVPQDIIKGKSAKETLKDTALNTAAFGVMNLGIKGLGKLGKESIGTKPIETPKIETVTKQSTPIIKKVDKNPTIINGKLKVKNVKYDKAIEEYNNAIEKIHNHFQTNKLTAEEIKTIKPKLGIDLESLTNNIAKYEKSNGLKEMANKNAMAYSVGLKTKPNNLLSNPLTKTEFNGSKIKTSKEIPSISVDSTTPIKLKLETVKVNKSLTDMTSNDFKNLKSNINKKLSSGRYLEGNRQALQRDLDKVNSIESSFSGKENVTQPNIPNVSKSGSMTSTALSDNPLDNSLTWKDKSKLSYKNNTMERNLYDIMPEDQAKKMVNTYIEPIRKNEANNIRELNQMRDDVKKIGVKAFSKESELAQKYGEGFITLNELKQATPNWQKAKDTADYMKNKYNELLDKANESLTRNGYDPIPKRQNYMPHMGDIEPLLKTLGIDNPELPTDINGLTGMFTPGKNWFGHALKRKGEQTAYDAVRGFDEYIDGVNKIVHHTDDIQKIRELENTIRTKHEGTTHLTNFASELKDYGNLLAGKKSEADRGFENIFGRKVYKVYDGVRKQIGANMIGGNVSSALTNFIPLNQALATTDKASFIKGMMESIGNVFKNDGFITKSDYLTRRIGSDKLAISNWQKVGKGANWMFKNVDNFVGQSIVRGKYNELLKKGLSESEALSQANNYAGSIMADRSLGMTPTLYQSKVLAPITQFQLEVNNQLHWITKDLPRNSKSKVALASAIGQLFVFDYAFNTIFEQATGRRPAFDPIGVALKSYQDYNNPKLKTTDANKNLIQNVANQLPYVGMVTGGRIPLSSALPDVYGVATGTTDAKKEAKKLSLLLLPTGGGQIKKTAEGLDTFNKGGVYNNDKLKFPVEKTNSNLLRNALFGQYSSPEATKYFDNAEKPLSEKQTSIYENKISQGVPSKEAYNKIITHRDVDSTLSKIKTIMKDRNLTRSEKGKEIKKLRSQLDKLKGK